MFKKIEDAGIRFVETTFAYWAQKVMEVDAEKADRDLTGKEQAIAGALAISAGGMLKTFGIVFLGLNVLLATLNPLTLVAGAGYVLASGAGAASIFFGKGMEKGGDNLSGLLTFQRELRHGVAEVAKEEFRSWRDRKFGKSFKNAVTPEPAVGATAAKTPAPAIKPETGGP